MIKKTDTGAFAHVRLPTTAWGEKDCTVTGSDRMISHQRALFPLPGETMPAACGRRALRSLRGCCGNADNGDLKAIEALLPKGERIDTQDAARGTRRIAIVANGRLTGALLVTESGELPPGDWLIAQLAAPSRVSPRLGDRGPGPIRPPPSRRCVRRGVAGSRSMFVEDMVDRAGF